MELTWLGHSAFRLRSGEKPAHCMEEKCPGAAGWVEYPLLQRMLNRLGADKLGQPVRRVILAQFVPLLWVDQRFV